MIKEYVINGKGTSRTNYIAQHERLRNLEKQPTNYTKPALDNFLSNQEKFTNIGLTEFLSVMTDFSNVDFKPDEMSGSYRLREYMKNDDNEEYHGSNHTFYTKDTVSVRELRTIIEEQSDGRPLLCDFTETICSRTKNQIMPISKKKIEKSRKYPYQIKCITIDIDYITVKDMEKMLSCFASDDILMPSIIEPTGRGVHLRYLLAQPIYCNIRFNSNGEIESQVLDSISILKNTIAGIIHYNLSKGMSEEELDLWNKTHKIDYHGNTAKQGYTFIGCYDKLYRSIIRGFKPVGSINDRVRTYTIEEIGRWVITGALFSRLSEVGILDEFSHSDLEILTRSREERVAWYENYKKEKDVEKYGHVLTEEEKKLKRKRAKAYEAKKMAIKNNHFNVKYKGDSLLERDCFEKLARLVVDEAEEGSRYKAVICLSHLAVISGCDTNIEIKAMVGDYIQEIKDKKHIEPFLDSDVDAAIKYNLSYGLDRCRNTSPKIVIEKIFPTIKIPFIIKTNKSLNRTRNTEQKKVINKLLDTQPDMFLVKSLNEIADYLKTVSVYTLLKYFPSKNIANYNFISNAITVGFKRHIKKTGVTEITYDFVYRWIEENYGDKKPFKKAKLTYQAKKQLVNDVYTAAMEARITKGKKLAKRTPWHKNRYAQNKNIWKLIMEISLEDSETPESVKNNINKLFYLDNKLNNPSTNDIYRSMSPYDKDKAMLSNYIEKYNQLSEYITLAESIEKSLGFKWNDNQIKAFNSATKFTDNENAPYWIYIARRYVPRIREDVTTRNAVASIFRKLFPIPVQQMIDRLLQKDEEKYNAFATYVRNEIVTPSNYYYLNDEEVKKKQIKTSEPSRRLAEIKAKLFRVKGTKLESTFNYTQ